MAPVDGSGLTSIEGTFTADDCARGRALCDKTMPMVPYEVIRTSWAAGREDQHDVQHQGVHYDTGTVFRGPGYAISTRRTALDMSVVRRELEIVRDDLHANAVRIVGSDVGHMTVVAKIAVGLGLEVWFSPAFFEYSLEETAAHWWQRPRGQHRCTRPIRGVWSSSPAASSRSSPQG